MNSKYVYTVFSADEPDDVLVEGAVKTIANKIGLTEQGVHHHIKMGTPIYFQDKTYLISKNEIIDYKKEKRTKKFDIELDRIKRHLDIYGDTIVWKEPSMFLKALEEIGYFTETKHTPRRVIKYRKSIDHPRFEVLDENWIIKLVKKESKND